MRRELERVSFELAMQKDDEQHVGLLLLLVGVSNHQFFFTAFNKPILQNKQFIKRESKGLC